MFKNTANTSKKCILNAYDFEIYWHFKMKKEHYPENRKCFWKRSFFLQFCKPFAWKMHLTLQKAAWEAKNASRGTIICEQWKYCIIMSQYTCNNALGFKLKIAWNLRRDKKNTSLKLQSAPNLHRDQKKQKCWTSKCAKPAQGPKKQKKTKTLQSTWEGSTIPLKFLFFFVPVQVWCTWKFKTFVFLSLCRFGALQA